MGCSVSTKNQTGIKKEAISSSIFPFRRQETTESTAKIIRRGCSTSRSSANFPITNCLRISIQESFHPITSYQYMPKNSRIFYLFPLNIKFFECIKKTYLKITSTKNYFLKKIHAVCIEKKLSNYIQILLISLLAGCKKKKTFNATAEVPFVIIDEECLENESLEMYKAWKDYVCALEEIFSNDFQELTLENSVKKLNEHMAALESNKNSISINELKKNFTQTKSAIQLAEKMYESSRRTLNEISKIFTEYGVYENFIRETSSKASKSKIYSGISIVHSILSN